MEQFYDPVADMRRERKPKKFIYFGAIFGALIIVLGLFFIFFGQRVYDYFAGRDYEPTPEMAEVIKNINITEDADLILRAVHPVIQDAAEFNENCPNRDEEMSTLGCFSVRLGQIFIYDIKSEELKGIKESVLAHELLHAIYSRFNNIELNQINDELDKFYAEHKDLFGNYLDSYSEDQFYTELHSVIGQRIKSADLPEALRKHYAKYFKDQDAIAGYYQKYRSIFDELAENIEKLSTEIEAEREEIRQERETYDQHAADYNAAAELFGNRATSGYYRTERALNEAYRILEKQWHELENERIALNDKIDAFNKKVNTLNDYVERNNALNRIVNSHIEKAEQDPTAEATK